MNPGRLAILRSHHIELAFDVPNCSSRPSIGCHFLKATHAKP
jgi:hypothetical protein